MALSIFSALCALCDDLDSAVRALEPGEVQDRLSVLVLRLDELADRTVGLEEPTGHEENGSAHA